MRSFQASRWFTRGWTLQELIAPSNVSFFSSEWTYFGCKSSLSKPIQMVTKINEDILKDPKLLRNMSIANRMSWAASRETTREEDIAYCLMGIFDINMPLLYGEGLKAFSRLQQEIMKESTDQSLLAWDNFSRYVPDATGATTGAFADHPRRFKDAANITCFDHLALFDGKGAASTITNRGLEIYLPVLVKHKPIRL
jgi:hypothetical protein